MSSFIQAAHATPATALATTASSSPSIVSVGMMAMMMVAFYFLIWRPQSKRTKEHRAMIDSVQPGSEVVFAGGLMGKVKALDGDFATVSIGLDKPVDVKVQKASVITVLPAGTLANT